MGFVPEVVVEDVGVRCGCAPLIAEVCATSDGLDWGPGGVAHGRQSQAEEGHGCDEGLHSGFGIGCWSQGQMGVSWYEIGVSQDGTGVGGLFYTCHLLSGVVRLGNDLHRRWIHVPYRVRRTPVSHFILVRVIISVELMAGTPQQPDNIKSLLGATASRD